VIGWRAGQDVANVRFADVPAMPEDWRKLGWPLTDMPDLQTSAGVTAGRIPVSAFWINVVALAVNLLPFRTLDGGQLLTAMRLWVSRPARVET
jgi:membrane-associated protease RseP (regulator of RpoE activity)